MFPPIDVSDLHHLRAAQGWAELGDFAEAEAELGRIPESLRTHPQVLDTRYQVLARAERWGMAAEVAGMLVESLAGFAGGWISLAYAVRRKPGGGILQAREILTKARTLFPKEYTIVYNLACYECQLGRPLPALELLSLAMTLGNKRLIKKMAEADLDLKPLWNEIPGM